LPGGAVLIDQRRLKSPAWQSAVSLAGPASNVILALLLSLLLRTVPQLANTSLGAGLSFLTVLQVSAVILNLLPVPGLDGFGIISPWLPSDVRTQAQTFGGNAIMLLFVAMWIVPGVNSLFWSMVYGATNVLGIDSDLSYSGLRAFQFWR
jgi:Zn-dependent protease